MQLTKRQSNILKFIESYQKKEGWAPSIREIAEACGLSSTSSVFRNLKVLENKGYIERMENSPRAIRVLNALTV